MQFADDMMLMSKATWENLWSIKTILRSFELVSGLKVNCHKSKLIGITISDEILETTTTFLHYSTQSTPFMFLGILVGTNPEEDGDLEADFRYSP